VGSFGLQPGRGKPGEGKGGVVPEIAAANPRREGRPTIENRHFAQDHAEHARDCFRPKAPCEWARFHCARRATFCTNVTP